MIHQFLARFSVILVIAVAYPNGPDELYNLANDPGEKRNLVHQSSLAVQSGELRSRLDQFFSEIASPQFDVLHEGDAQTVIFDQESQSKMNEIASSVESENSEDAAHSPVVSDKSDQILVPEDYTVELVADSSLVQHPMMAGFDDRGRLFVAESAGLNLRSDDLEKQLPNSIKMLEDTDLDGVFDTSTVFADKMTLPMGACWYRDALYVASPPHIWKLKDTDDDGVADVREKLPAKFGYNGNAASIHGCFVSPDGRIYWCDGRHGHDLEDENGNILSSRSGSFIFSCLPDGSDIQRHCGGGMDNPVEVDFTTTGDVLGTVNILYTGPRIDCLVHWLHGGTYPHSERVLAELPRTGELLGPVHQFGHVAVSGMTRYRSGWLDRDFTEDIFVTIFNTGQVVRLKLDQQGSTYKSQQFEFLRCSDPDFHPTDVLEDADGSLLLVDTGGWFRIGCPTSQIAKPDIHGGIYRIRKNGMARVADPRGQEIDWSNQTNEELIGLFNDARFAVQERAIDQCALRGDVIVPQLTSAATKSTLRVRQNALWALTRIRSQDSQAGVRKAFHDRDETVRAIAAKSAGVTRDPQAVSPLIGQLESDSPHLRRVALTSLGQIGDASAVPAILEAAEYLTDRAEDHALIYALMEINSPDATRSGLSAKNANTRRAALIALDQMPNQALTAEEVAQAIQRGGEELLNAALLSLNHHPEWSSSVADLLQQWVAGELQLEYKSVETLVARFSQSEEIQQVIESGLTTLQNRPGDLLTVLKGIGASSLKAFPETWTDVYHQLLDSDDLSIKFASLQSLKRMELNGTTSSGQLLLSQCLRIANDPATDPNIRLAAIVVTPASLDTSAFELVIKLIDSERNSNRANQAIEILNRSELTSEQLQSVVQLIPAAGPLELPQLLAPFRRVQEETVIECLVTSLESARSRSSLSSAQLDQLVKDWKPSSKTRLQSLRDELSQLQGQQVDKLNRLEPLVRSASSERGRVVFFSEQAKCAICHRVGQQGGRIGPDLSAIGRIRRERDLLEAVLFPSKSFAREYEPYTVTTDNGKVYSGLMTKETDDAIWIQQATGDPIEIRRETIEDLSSSPVSVMPQGLETGLSESQLADLVAYLRSLTDSADVVDRR